jgi:CRP/FNR family cyclic AMP-dependent transcriptional regulator
VSLSGSTPDGRKSKLISHPRQCLEPTPDRLFQGSGADLPALTSPLFRNLDDGAIRRLLDASQRQAFRAGEHLCRQGEPATGLYLLTSGLVKAIGSTTSGDQVLFDWMYAGDVVGVGAILSPPASYDWTALATEDTQTLHWDSGGINGLGAMSPCLYENALWITLRSAHELQARFQVLATGMVEQRIAYVTLHLADRIKSDANGTFELRVSDEEIAQMTGTNVFTVNKILNRWRREGYVAKVRKRLSIRDRENISRILLRPN